MNSIHAIILAAGESKRLGFPKQLIRFKGQFLINYLIDIAYESGLENISVILGAKKSQINKIVNQDKSAVVLNEEWKAGMSTSLIKGIEKCMAHNAEAALIMTCDQPLVTTSLVKEIIEKYTLEKNKIITCQYKNTFGPPTLFPKSSFESIRNLEGDKGAKDILVKNRENVLFIDFPDGEFDIDTQSDLDNLNEMILNQ